MTLNATVALALDPTFISQIRAAAVGYASTALSAAPGTNAGVAARATSSPSRCSRTAARHSSPGWSGASPARPGSAASRAIRPTPTTPRSRARWSASGTSSPWSRAPSPRRIDRPVSYTYIQGAASAATIAATTQTAEFGSTPAGRGPGGGRGPDLSIARAPSRSRTITPTHGHLIDPATHGSEYAYLYASTLTSVGSGFTVTATFGNAGQ